MYPAAVAMDCAQLFSRMVKSDESRAPCEQLENGESEND